jgi:hypothetical protein
MRRMIRILFLMELLFCWIYGAAAFESHSEPQKAGLNFNDNKAAGKEQATSSFHVQGIVPNPASPYLPMTKKEKFHFYLKTTFAPQQFLFSAASAGIKQAYDSVPEWGQGMEGYGKRFGSTYGKNAIGYTISFGVGLMLREDPRYFKSHNSGLWKRGLHALGQSFIAHADSGRIHPGYSNFISITASEYVSQQWHPENERTTRNYLEGVGISFGTNIAQNIFQEFWPDIKKGFKK